MDIGLCGYWSMVSVDIGPWSMWLLVRVLCGFILVTANCKQAKRQSR